MADPSAAEVAEVVAVVMATLAKARAKASGPGPGIGQQPQAAQQVAPVAAGTWGAPPLPAAPLPAALPGPPGSGWLDGGRCLRCRRGGWRGARSVVRASNARTGPATASA